MLHCIFQFLLIHVEEKKSCSFPDYLHTEAELRTAEEDKHQLQQVLGAEPMAICSQTAVPMKPIFRAAADQESRSIDAHRIAAERQRVQEEVRRTTAEKERVQAEIYDAEIALAQKQAEVSPLNSVWKCDLILRGPTLLIWRVCAARARHPGVSQGCGRAQGHTLDR
jgi:hypothetical protein